MVGSRGISNSSWKGLAVLVVLALLFSGVATLNSSALAGATTSAPVIKRLTPQYARPAGGGTMTITGTNLSGATSVRFGTKPASIVGTPSSTSMTVTIPPGTLGTVKVSVTTPNGMSPSTSKCRFTYLGVPSILENRPSVGPTAGGTTVAIFGRNLTAATVVKFGSVAATRVVALSSTSILVDAPPHAAGTVHLRVTSPGGLSKKVSSDRFTYVAPAPPAISSLAPTSGPTYGGTRVVIVGTAFTDATDVSFGGNPATSFTVDSDTQITAIAPAGNPGLADVSVTTALGTSATVSEDEFTYDVPAPPDIVAVTPASGTSLGGTSVTITGSSFTGATDVSFGSTAAVSYTVDSDSQITAVTPAGDPGAVDVIVTTPFGVSTSSSADAFTFVAPSAPTVTLLTPNSGSTEGGTTVVITGTDFTAATDVSFGGSSVTGFVIDSDTQITTTAPAGTEGVVDVTVTNGIGTSAVVGTDEFTYVVPPPPTIDSLDPTSGSTEGGTTVVITGTDFAGATDVTFGSTPALSFTVDSPSQITAVSPGSGAGTINVRVTTAEGMSAIVSSDEFTFVAPPPPSLDSLDPTSGSTEGGTTVVITGAGFTGATDVTFGGDSVTGFVIDSDTQITATSPAHAPGTVEVTVTSGFGISGSSSADQFTYVTPPPPSLDSLDPTSGSTEGGTTVTITGTDFTGATDVSFGATAATSFTVDSATQISAVAPAGAAGTVDVTVTTAEGTSAVSSADEFTYVVPPAPSVSSLSPTTGSTAGGTTVTITGTDFTGATDVSFGATAATSFTVDSATQITAVAPAGAAGTVDVTVTTAEGTSATSSADEFTWVVPVVPSVTSLSPSVGGTAGGSSVVITGTDFIGATDVSFGGTSATGFTIDSNTQITAVAPAGTAGTVDVTVTTSGGTSTTSASDEYTYDDSPRILSVENNAGNSWGGYYVTLHGVNLSGATSVGFGTYDMTSSFTSAGDGSSISVYVNGATYTPGLVDVSVTTPNGTATSTNGFEFLPFRLAWWAMDPNRYMAVGDVITESFVVYNQSAWPPQDQSGVQIASSIGATVSCDWATPGTLQGNQTNCTATYTITQGDVDAGHVTETISVTGSLTPRSLTIGGTINYLAPDPSAGIPSITSIGDSVTSLLGGQSVTLYGTNLGTAWRVLFGTFPSGSVMVNGDGSVTAQVPGHQFPLGFGDVTVITAGGSNTFVNGVEFAPFKPQWYSVSPGTYSNVGDVISYSFVVYNHNGWPPAPLSGVTITSSAAADLTCNWATPGEIPGGQVNCSGTHTVSQEDIDAGTIQDVVSIWNPQVTGTMTWTHSISYSAP